jgi:hypothetical protein
LTPARKQGIYEPSILLGLSETPTALNMAGSSDPNNSSIYPGSLLLCMKNASDCLSPLFPSGTSSSTAF